MSSTSTQFYVAQAVALLMAGPKLHRDIRISLGCDRATILRIISALREAGVIYAQSYPPVRQGPIMAVWALQTSPFAMPDAVKKTPDYVLLRNKRLANPKPVKVEKPAKVPKVIVPKPVKEKRKRSHDPEIVRRKADFDLPVGIPNSIFDVR